MSTSNNSSDSKLVRSSTIKSSRDLDWKLSPNVQVKIVLKKLPIEDSNGSVRETSNSTAAAVTSSSKGVKRRRMSMSSSMSRTPARTEKEAVIDSSGNDPWLLNSGDIIQELQKVILEFEPECTICCKFVCQLTQHIRDLHSPPIRAPIHGHYQEQASSSPIRPRTRSSHSTAETETESETFAIDVSNNGMDYNWYLCEQKFLISADLQTHLGSHTPPNIRLDIQETHISSRVREAEPDVTGHRRSSRTRRRINYAELLDEPQTTTTTVFTDNQDISGIPDIPEQNIFGSLIVENIKHETAEIEFRDNEDALFNPEGDQDGDYGNNLDDCAVSDDDSDSEFEDPFKSTTTTIPSTNPRKQKIANSDKPYKCDNCETYFTRMDSLRKHSLKQHPSKAVFTCDVCQAGFKKFRKFFNHKKTHCGKKSSWKRNQTLQRKRRNDHEETHGIIHTMKKSHKCEQCGECFLMETDLIQHNKCHASYGKKSHKCVTCGESFGKKCVLIMHERLHTNKRPYICEHCDKCFLSNAVRINHERSHKNCDPPKPHKEQSTTRGKISETVKTCEKCDIHFHTTVSLNRHNGRFHGIETGKQYKRRTRGKKRFRIRTGKKLNKCETCGKYFVRKHVLEIHRRLHTGEKPYKCKCCNLSFYSTGERLKHVFELKRRSDLHECAHCGLKLSTRKKLVIHMISTHAAHLATPYMCNVCKMFFSTSAEIRHHLGQIHPTTLPYACKPCKKRFVEKSDLAKHFLTHAPLNRYKCDHCSRAYQFPHQLEIHMEIHTKEKPLKCDTCEKTFNVKAALIKHQDGHTPGKTFNCEQCDQSFNSRDVLITHTERHKEQEDISEIDSRKKSDEMNYGCGICGKLFATTETLSTHLHRTHHRTHEDILPKSYVCKFCKEGFCSKIKLNAHVKQLHPGKKSFECKICHKEYAKEHMLNEHSKNVHTEKMEKTIPCSHSGCTKMFKTKNHMLQHTLSIFHLGEKFYKCNECGKTFASASTLSMHKVTHTGARPFMCEKCSKCFPRNYSLKVHMMTHGDEDGVKLKPYVCKDCGKAFMLKGQLTDHSLIHTGEKTHMCEDCGMCFRLPHQLRAHLKSLVHAK